MPATGKITQVIGSTFDVEFPENALPSIYNAVTIAGDYDGKHRTLVGEATAPVDLLLVTRDA